MRGRTGEDGLPAINGDTLQCGVSKSTILRLVRTMVACKGKVPVGEIGESCPASPREPANIGKTAKLPVAISRWFAGQWGSPMITSTMGYRGLHVTAP